MITAHYFVQTFDPTENTLRKHEVIDFLKQQNLDFASGMHFTVAIYREEELIATGSLDRNVLKCFAVSPKYRHRGLTNELVTILTKEAAQTNQSHLFIYTKPKNRHLFESLGYHAVEEADDVILLENKTNGIANFANQLSRNYISGKSIAGMVMNCNPFTKGHQYLIQKAASENDVVHLFIVQENRSLFQTEERIEMVRRGIASLDNVHLHCSGDYIISNATFPSYFIKDKETVIKAHAQLDLKIFAKQIAPALKITKRYVGEEPFSRKTAIYNQFMHQILPGFGMEVKEIPRKAENGTAISASHVRELLMNNEMEAVRSLVPTTTFDYLCQWKKNRRER
ncbi:[citrate (pro-3S)-lyase] ligase [Sporolactobacillus pectinivorans]|uniref:[citrate (pro-3S)-lyase] ligase n=1 Tax=Sporolactobacillus pectinivorans TaxID=1591408 RepID=UPI000C2587E6|nr:[citrate (pro-3S)-lyase] ligase [Sporolactobacillus pectinivorans]